MTMKKAAMAGFSSSKAMRRLVATAMLASMAPAAFADDSWQGTTATWSTAGNWSTGISPSTAPVDSAVYPGNATIQTLDLAAGTGRVSIGARFDLFSGGIGYTFNGTAGSVAGFFLRSGGAINGILNNDDNAQTFNVPIKLTSNSGIAGAAAAMAFNAAAGDLIFNGNNNAPAALWTINLNGASALTIDGAHNVTIGSSGPGQIVNTNVGTFSGIIKKGVGTLSLGGTAANTYSGTNVLMAGTTLAAKANALGANNALTLGGGTFNSGGLNQALGVLSLTNASTLNFGSGSSAVSFANSSVLDWAGNTLSVLNWTSGSDTLRFGTDATGLTSAQLGDIFFTDLGNVGAQIDGNGFVTPLAPEPGTVAIGLAGGIGLLLFGLRRRIHS